jgi:tRNA G10  N-methylase Trm11
VTSLDQKFLAKHRDVLADHPMPSTEYLFVFAQSHEEFRVPELLSISELYGFAIGLDRYASSVLDKVVKRPFMILTLDKEEHAKILAERCIMIKCVSMNYYKLSAQRIDILSDPFMSSMPRARPTRRCTNKTAEFACNGNGIFQIHRSNFL